MPNIQLGFNGNFSDMEEILSNYQDLISTLFFPAPNYVCGTGRRGAEIKNMKDIDSCINLAHKFGMKAKVLMNTVTESVEALSKDYTQKIKETIALIPNIDIVTINHPIIMSAVNNVRDRLNLDLQIEAGTWSGVGTFISMDVLHILGVNRFTLDVNANKDFQAIKHVRDQTLMPIVMLVSEPCMIGCPYRRFHSQSVTRRTYNTPPKTDFEYFELCRTIQYNNPILLLNSAITRPEDFEIFEEAGINEFKLGSRCWPKKKITWWLDNIREREYEGNYVDYFDILWRFQYHDKPYIDNRGLDGMVRAIKCNPLHKSIIYYHYLSRSLRKNA